MAGTLLPEPSFSGASSFCFPSPPWSSPFLRALRVTPAILRPGLLCRHGLINADRHRQPAHAVCRLELVSLTLLRATALRGRPHTEGCPEILSLREASRPPSRLASTSSMESSAPSSLQVCGIPNSPDPHETVALDRPRRDPFGSRASELRWLRFRLVGLGRLSGDATNAAALVASGFRVAGIRPAGPRMLRVGFGRATAGSAGRDPVEPRRPDPLDCRSWPPYPWSMARVTALRSDRSPPAVRLFVAIAQEAAACWAPMDPRPESSRRVVPLRAAVTYATAAKPRGLLRSHRGHGSWPVRDRRRRFGRRPRTAFHRRWRPTLPLCSLLSVSRLVPPLAEILAGMFSMLRPRPFAMNRGRDDSWDHPSPLRNQRHRTSTTTFRSLRHALLLHAPRPHQKTGAARVAPDPGPACRSA